MARSRPSGAVYLMTGPLSLEHAHRPASCIATSTANIMVTSMRRKIMDSASHAYRRRTPGRLHDGTPAYMPPEQVLGRTWMRGRNCTPVGVVF